METTPVATGDDAADDPAIWIHPQYPEKSRVLGTDKQRGLEVYDLDGRLLQSLSDGRLNNVDLRDGFRVNGRPYALVAATNRTSRTLTFYLLDPATSELRRAGASVPTGFAEPYGLCMYASPGGEYFVFASDAGSGQFRQWRVWSEGDRILADPVRRFTVGSQSEGCAADDETGALYVAEEGIGLWRYEADPDSGNRRRAIDRIGGGSGLVPDLEGVAIWRGPGGRGYIVLSNQGADNYAVYRREGDNAFVGHFRIAEHGELGIDGTSETDGLEVASHPIGSRYPAGLLVVQDGSNEPAGQHQNFKLVSWEDVEQALRLGTGE
jgi:3-phytase